jgi:hypothetical protein
MVPIFLFLCILHISLNGVKVDSKEVDEIRGWRDEALFSMMGELGGGGIWVDL